MRRLLALLALGAALTACGDSVSKPDYVAKADGACAPGNATLAGVTKPTNLPELGTAAGTVATTVDGQVAALRKLEAPGDDKAQVAGVVNALAEVSAPAKALQEAAGKTDDAAAARAANDLKAKADAAATQAKGYGLNTCGSGLQGPVNTVVDGGKTVLKAAFVAKADALCTAANRKVDALPEATSLATEARYMAAYMPIEEKLFADIKALAVPPGDESTVAGMLAAQDQVIAKDREMATAAQQRNQRLFNQLNEENVPLITAANAKFDEYGLRTCGTLSRF